VKIHNKNYDTIAGKKGKSGKQKNTPSEKRERLNVIPKMGIIP
jgi:hypothetical protein